MKSLILNRIRRNIYIIHISHARHRLVEHYRSTSTPHLNLWSLALLLLLCLRRAVRVVLPQLRTTQGLSRRFNHHTASTSKMQLSEFAVRFKSAQRPRLVPRPCDSVLSVISPTMKSSNRRPISFSQSTIPFLVHVARYRPYDLMLFFLHRCIKSQ